MPLQSHSRIQDTPKFILYDDSRRSRVVLGSTFSMQNPDRGIEGIKTLLHQVSSLHENWHYTDTLLTMEIVNQVKGKAHWIIGCEENAVNGKVYRAVATSLADDADYHLQVDDDFKVEGEPHDLMECLPDSVFGVLLGAATGMTEVKKLLFDAAKGQSHPSSETPRSDWRAPRFSFTLQTAAGSPFVERWGFAIQESAIRTERFRVWIEQLRTGKEMQLLLRDDGSIEGIHDIETLPAAIHGAALGMLIGINHMLHHVAKTQFDSQEQAFVAGLSDQEAEALLEQYVAQIRERRNTMSND